jgi:heat shock protein HslJ
MRAAFFMALLLAGCAAGPQPSGASGGGSADGLAGTRWELVKFQSSDDVIGTQRPEDPSHYVLELMSDGHLAAQLDCNRAVGTWKAHPTSPKQGTITLDAPAMTRAACLPASWDDRLARDFGYVVSYTLEGDQLHLALKLDSGIYTWRRLP